MTPEELLLKFDDDVRALAERLRRLVRDHAHGSVERTHAGWRALGYVDEGAGYYCGIFPFQDHVRLQFEHGVELVDPLGRLEGDGRQTRYLTLRPGDDIPSAAIRELLDQAVRRGSIGRKRRE